MASQSRILLLRRADHHSRLTSGFECLLESEAMTDVTLACDDHVVRAHRTVLSIFSPFFKRLFDSIQNPLHYPFVVLKDMPYDDLKAIIDLMYRGEVTVTRDQFHSLKSSAKTLEVSELSDIIDSYEEKTGIITKTEDINALFVRNTRKRGRPRRYCDNIEVDSEEDVKVFSSSGPPTKRQQVLLSKTTGMITKSTNLSTNKPQTAIRGGHLPQLGRPATAIRGAHSFGYKPQTAVRGGHYGGVVKPQTALRGGVRGRGTRIKIESDVDPNDEDYIPIQDTVRRGNSRRGRRPRLSADLPMASNLIQNSESVDLENIFPNYNPSDVTSSTSDTSNTTNRPIPVTFETVVKQEPDSDSEVECIMSATSPLPSSVEEIPIPNETLDSIVNDISSNSESQQNELQTNELSNDLTVSESISVSKSTTESIATTSDENQTISSNTVSDVRIKTERPDTPIIDREVTTLQQIQQSIDSGSNSSSIDNQVINSTTAIQSSESVSVTPSTINSVINTTNVPLLHVIKTERFSPTIDSQTFSQSITDLEPNISNSSEQPIITESTIPVLSTIKTERLSPNNIENNIIDISEENSQTETVVSSSHTTETVVNQVLNDELVITDSIETTLEPQLTDQIITIEDNNLFTDSTISSTPQTDVISQTFTDYDQQNTCENSGAVDVNVQQIVFDAFYSDNSDQPLQTLATEASSSTSSTTNHSLINLNIENNSLNEQNTQFMAASDSTNNYFTNQTITTSVPMQVASDEQTITTNTGNFLDNNIVMNSPIHSDEECMLLDSPSQDYHKTLGSDNLDDSMDDNN
ncbi:dentin sialophosphoprotein-like [Oppia nitens]|uniref:dentin sialophosphoprotein-like n=1 Tax=Oppia nitens TaxID=1686743 RepID=UPI0023DB8B4E|nr:dentin sialophosphoprotein-like [Oppia nitens]